MLKHLKKINHLVRYFFVLGIAVFTLYHFKVFDQITLYLIGPCMKLGYTLREQLPFLPSGHGANHWGILLPLTIVYFTSVGALLKILWNEKGGLGTLCFGTFSLFLLFIHYFTGKELLGYFFTY